jgi:predicted transcriptional regulator
MKCGKLGFQKLCDRIAENIMRRRRRREEKFVLFVLGEKNALERKIEETFWMRGFFLP